MSAAQHDEAEEDVDPAISKAWNEMLHRMNTALAGYKDLDPDARRTVCLGVGSDCIMSAVASAADRQTMLIGTIKVMIETAIKQGWLPKRPAGASMVLVLSDEDTRIEGRSPSRAVH